MSLELVNTFGTLLTVAIIAATAIAAMVQLRHLRAGNQINAMISIGNQVDQIQDANTLVRQKLDSALEDPAYRVTSSRVTGACRCRLSQESIASSMLQHFLLATPMTSWAFSSKKEHRDGTYPAGVRRLQPHNPWPVPPMPATA